MPSRRSPIAQPAISSAARLRKSRRKRALRGFRRVDITLQPDAGAALDLLMNEQECTATEAVAAALMFHARMLKRKS